MTGYFTGLPQAIEVKGAEIPINTDFRASISFEEIMQDKALNPEEQLAKMLECYFDDPTLATIAALVDSGETESFLDAVFSFYRCGKKATKAAGEKKQPRPSYSFAYDSEFIFAAFLEQYGLDLYTTPYLHWYKFRAMFSALSDTCEFVKVMRIRTAVPDKHMSAKERSALRKAKAAYALPDLRSPEQIEADFTAGFASMF